ncbi:MAG: hypothetical protein EBZ48_13965 [Proteobacteria bacterium]|nr:hypothetical protein [Pseudomonadota bacterium]
MWPLHPDTLAYSMQLCGLTIVETRMLSAVPPEACLQEIPLAEELTPRLARVFETMNANIRQLNELLYGSQDFCIVAERH